jgi:hypothetical protein
VGEVNDGGHDDLAIRSAGVVVGDDEDRRGRQLSASV